MISTLSEASVPMHETVQSLVSLVPDLSVRVPGHLLFLHL